MKCTWNTQAVPDRTFFQSLSPSSRGGLLSGSLCSLLFFCFINCYFTLEYSWLRGFPGGSVGKEPACNAGDAGDMGSIPGVRKIPWRRAWQPIPVFLPGEFHGQRSLAGYSPWGHKESDLTEVWLRWLSTQAHTRAHTVDNAVRVSSTTKWVSDARIHVSILSHIIFLFWLLQSTEESSVCCKCVLVGYLF